MSRLLHKPLAGGGPYFPFFAPVDAGWSSPVARQAHNLKVIGSNPIPATKLRRQVKDLAALPFLRLCLEPASKHWGSKKGRNHRQISGLARGPRLAHSPCSMVAAVAASRRRGCSVLARSARHAQSSARYPEASRMPRRQRGQNSHSLRAARPMLGMTFVDAATSASRSKTCVRGRDHWGRTGPPPLTAGLSCFANRFASCPAIARSPFMARSLELRPDAT